MTKRCNPSGPPDARVMIVGEAPGEKEIDKGFPFANPHGAGGMLNNILPPSIKREDCFITNVTPFRPPMNNISHWIKRHDKGKKKGLVEHSNEIAFGLQELEEQIDAIRPDHIIALGNTALWATTGEWGISKWRGSMLHHHRTGIKVTPTYHPASILRMYKQRWIAQHDLKTAAKFIGKGWPVRDYSFEFQPDYGHVVDLLDWLRGREKIAVDIETTPLDISCIGFAWSPENALCIPFTQSGSNPNYWKPEEELEIVLRIKRLLEEDGPEIVGQNFNYDRQYLARCWGINSRLTRDTMTYHHTLFSQLPKGLDFISSLYCQYHVYWKDESKGRDEVKADDITFWTYNCKDCVATFEADTVLKETWDKRDKTPVEFQQSLHDPILKTTLRGTRFDNQVREKLKGEILERMAEDEREFLLYSGGDHIIGVKNSKSSWWNSYTQTGNFFYDELGIPPIYNGSSRTTDDKALERIGKKEPLVRKLTARLQDYRSRRTYLNTFILVSVDHDGRIRCQYKIDGTETFRFASSSDAFGFGTNLQNLPKGSEGKHLPNIRTMFVPDPGFFFWDADLQQADAQVVAWESGAKRLKEICLDPSLSLHNENCKLLYGKYPETDKEKNDANGIRQKSKKGVHSLHYGGQDRTLARDLGITVRQAHEFRRIYFSANPEIPAWHDAIQYRLAKGNGIIFNKFGHFTFFFDRPEKNFTEAIAWVPQSTVGIVINHGYIKLNQNFSHEDVCPLLQVHDSLAGQGRLDRKEILLPQIKQAMEISIPYDDPLTIGVDVKSSDISWGDCE